MQYYQCASLAPILTESAQIIFHLRQQFSSNSTRQSEHKLIVLSPSLANVVCISSIESAPFESLAYLFDIAHLISTLVLLPSWLRVHRQHALHIGQTAVGWSSMARFLRNTEWPLSIANGDSPLEPHSRSVRMQSHSIAEAVFFIWVQSGRSSVSLFLP